MSNDLTQFFGGQAFNTGMAKPAEDFIVLPPGDYPVLIEAAPIKATKKNDGHYVEVAMTILDGPAKGRKLWDRMNIDNPNPTAREIAMRSLSAILTAVGMPTCQNTDLIVGRSCVAHVKEKDGENNIRTYSPFADYQSVQVPQQPVPMLPPPAQAPMQQAPMQQAPMQQAPMQQQPVQQQPIPPTHVLPPQPVQQYLASGSPDPFQQPILQQQPAVASPPWQRGQQPV